MSLILSLPFGGPSTTRAARRVLPALVCAVLLGACGGADSSRETFEASPNAKRYPITGIVRAVSPEDGTLSVAHEAIDGLMDAMTMDFHVRDAWVLRAAGPGDRISATLVLDGARSWLEEVVLSQADSASAANPSGAAADIEGTPLPDVALTNQDGESVRTSQYQGRSAVYTFIYTRCPLPDYCPLMLRRLNELAKRLEAENRRDDVWLIAVTLDPAFDTPAVLKAYGDQQVEADNAARRYERFALLTGESDAIRTLASTFQLTYETEGDELIHGLRTAVVDADGHIVRVFRGSDWTVTQVLDALPPAAE